ncbi:unnamed protein product [Sphagnum tenellum]
MISGEPIWSDDESAEKGLRDLNFSMCGREDLTSHIEELRAKGEQQCNKVWAKGKIAYRCRTCQLNDSSAICVDCFQAGDHRNHDYVMYHSESGGCCDCGDKDAWKISGFCNIHGSLQVQMCTLADELVDKTHEAVRCVLRELSIWIVIRKKTTGPMHEHHETMTLKYLQWSQQVCSVDVLRNIVCEDVIRNFVQRWDESPNLTSPLELLLDTLPSMSQRVIEAETTLFLQLLYKSEFKHDFSEVLKDKYEKIVIPAVNDEVPNYDYVDTNLDRVMVQLFNVPDITNKLIEDHNLLECFTTVFCDVISRCTKGDHSIVDVEHGAIKRKVYLRPQGDLRLILNTNVAVNMLRNQADLFKKILETLTHLQWMNPYIRGQDVKIENAWTLSIQLEMNSMAIVFQLVSRCYQHSDDLAHLRYTGSLAPDSQTSSLHIPLHRTLTAILAKLILLNWDEHNGSFFPALNFTYTEEEVMSLIWQPLCICVWMAQIRAQMWNAISVEFSRLELIYRGSFWHDQSMDMDLLLLQFGTVARENMEQKIFVQMAECFELKEMVCSFLLDGKIPRLRSSKISLLQDFMRLVLLIVRGRRHTGVDDGECLRYDVVQWLCVRNQTYSQLCHALSAVPTDHHELAAILADVAIYHEPKISDRGHYELKAECWKEFDPLFGNYYLNELEEAQERAVSVGKQHQYWRIRAPPPAKQPYDRLSNLLHTMACHQFLINVLNYVSILVSEDSTVTDGEALGVIALQLMAVVVSDLKNDPWSRGLKRSEQSLTEPQSSFPSNDISLNTYLRPCLKSDTTVCWTRGNSDLPSIHDLLLKLQKSKGSPRLVDSIKHVLDLLSIHCKNADEAETSGSQVPSTNLQVVSLAAEDEQWVRNEQQRKRDRQKAILDQFAVRQKAFLEQQLEEDDVVNALEDAEGKGQTLEETTVGSKASIVPSPDAVGNSSRVEGTSMAMETSYSHDGYECVLCKSMRDRDNSPAGWIALVQQYSLPSLVLSRGKVVDNFEDVEALVNRPSPRGLDRLEDEESKQLTTVMYDTDVYGVGSIDQQAPEHVQCCGHQMHLSCFQDYYNSLVRRHSSETGYPGKGLVDLGKCEFLCPTCRRLANVILPHVDTTILERHESQESRDFQAALKSITNSITFFTSQANSIPEPFNVLKCPTSAMKQQSTLRVRSNSAIFKEDTTSCQVLWEVLALNIVHCELVTREEGPLKVDGASSSSSTVQPKDQQTWGGCSSHWIALQELGKLAMFINIARHTEKGQWRVNLRKAMKYFSKNPLLETIIPAPDTNELEKDGLGKKKETAESVRLVKSIQQSDMLSPSKPEMKSEGGGETNVSQLPTMLVANFWTQETRGSSSKVDVQEDVKDKEHPTDWISDICDNEILAADPFKLLVVLLITYSGQPKPSVILLMVKFAYVIAVAQASTALWQLRREAGGYQNLSSSIQMACLPFLRRAALLVQIITGKDLDGLWDGPAGQKVMDAAYLLTELHLPDPASTLNFGASDCLAYSFEMRLEHLQWGQRSPKLYKVPEKVVLHSLPRVYQELLAKYIHGKEQCTSCKQLPKEPAICLICGDLLCYSQELCGKQGNKNRTCHAKNDSEESGDGIRIFFLLRSTQLVLIRGNRVFTGLSIYLDHHGEEDLYLRRSQLLYLNDIRMNEVRRLWLTAGFDYDSYILHHSRQRGPRKSFGYSR